MIKMAQLAKQVQTDYRNGWCLVAGKGGGEALIIVILKLTKRSKSNNNLCTVTVDWKHW